LENGNWNGSYFNINENMGGATDDFVLKLISRGNTASLHTWNIFYKSQFLLILSSTEILEVKDCIFRSNIRCTEHAYTWQFSISVAWVSTTSGIVLSWTGGYFSYGITGYEISFVIRDIELDILFINSTLSVVYIYTLQTLTVMKFTSK
jgi:hypothetical protein